VSGSDPASNDNSLVLRLRQGAVAMLLTGDLEEAGIPVMLDHTRALEADMLKVPHHGSRLHEAGEALVQAVGPKLAVVSVGRLHRLPAAETLETFARRGIPVVSTREQGSIHLRTDGARLELRTFKGAQGWTAIR
jgi:competence protein ComEC